MGNTLEKKVFETQCQRAEFKGILQNCHFFNNEEADKSDKSFKLKSLITYLSQSFFHCVSNDATQSVNDQKN